MSAGAWQEGGFWSPALLKEWRTNHRINERQLYRLSVSHVCRWYKPKIGMGGMHATWRSRVDSYISTRRGWPLVGIMLCGYCV